MEPFVNPPSRYNPLFPIPSRPPQSWQGSCIYHKDFVPFTPHPSERHDFRVASYCDLLKNGTQGKGHMKTSLLKSCAIYGFVVKTRSGQKRKLMIGCSTKSFFPSKRIPLKTNKVGSFLKKKYPKNLEDILAVISKYFQFPILLWITVIVERTTVSANIC